LETFPDKNLSLIISFFQTKIFLKDIFCNFYVMTFLEPKLNIDGNSGKD